MTDDKRTFRSTFTSYNENVGGPITGNVSEEFRLYPASAVEVAYAKGYAAGAEVMLEAALEWGYDLGFGASDEGWNAQCGVDSSEEKAEWIDQRNKIIAAAIAAALASKEPRND